MFTKCYFGKSDHKGKNQLAQLGNLVFTGNDSRSCGVLYASAYVPELLIYVGQLGVKGLETFAINIDI